MPRPEFGAGRGPRDDASAFRQTPSTLHCIAHGRPSFQARKGTSIPNKRRDVCRLTRRTHASPRKSIARTKVPLPSATRATSRGQPPPPSHLCHKSISLALQAIQPPLPHHCQRRVADAIRTAGDHLVLASPCPRASLVTHLSHSSEDRSRVSEFASSSGKLHESRFAISAFQ